MLEAIFAFDTHFYGQKKGPVFDLDEDFLGTVQKHMPWGRSTVL
jgi:hypothetical protein